MKKRKWLRCFFAALIVAVILLCPLPITRATKELAAAKAIAALFNSSTVIHVSQQELPWGPIDPLPSAGYFGYDSIYLCNEANLDLGDSIQRYKLKEFTDDDDEELLDDNSRWYSQNRLVCITNKDPLPEDDGDEPALRLSCFFGSLAGNGFRLRIYRCILGTFVFYDYEFSC